MRRGEVWTIAGGSDYATKPRPAVIVQDDGFDDLASITVCMFTTNAMHASLFRIAVETNETNGLSQTSWLMADKLMTVPKEKLGRRIGHLDDDTMKQLGHAIVVFLGLAS